jgi:hypothetical protein
VTVIKGDSNMGTQETGDLTNAEVGLLLVATPLFYVGLSYLCLIGADFLDRYGYLGEAMFAGTMVGVLAFDLVWAVMLRRQRLIMGKRTRVYASVLVYVVSASILTGLYIAAGLKASA